MNASLVLLDRQRARKINRRHLRSILRCLLRQELERDQFALGVYLVDEAEMTRLNETYLHHRGCTDVITFDYGDPQRPEWLGGDIFVCLAEAVSQAGKFRTRWQSELVRYAVHGVLHLCGYDDQGIGARRRMKREEDRLVCRLANRFNFSHLAAKPKTPTASSAKS